MRGLVWGRRAALKHFEEAHATAAAWAWRVGIIVRATRAVGVSRAVGRLHPQQLACGRDVLGLGGSGEEAVMADAMGALRGGGNEEATDELPGGGHHGCVEGGPLAAGVLYLY